MNKKFLEEIGLNKEEHLAGHRHTQAFYLEQLAQKAEVKKAKLATLVEKHRARVDVSLEAKDAALSAQIDRERADKLHALAGTEPSQFYAQIAVVLRTELRQRAAELIQAEEAYEHVDIYGGTPEEREFNQDAVAAEVEALYAQILELEKEAAK